MVGVIPADVNMEARPVGRGYVRLRETGHGPWPLAGDGGKPASFHAHEFHYSRFENLDKDARFAFEVERGTGIDGDNDGYISHNLLACYTHQHNTIDNPWAERFIDFVRRVKQS